MEVRPYGNEKLRYEVESESDSGVWYIVDLTTDRDYYGCSCKNFEYNLSMNVREGYELFVRGSTMCKHQEQALKYMAICCIKEINK